MAISTSICLNLMRWNKVFYLSYWVLKDCCASYMEFRNLQTCWSSSFGFFKPLGIFIYIFSCKMPHKKVILISNWWTSRSKCFANVNIICTQFILTMMEKVSPKSQLATCVNPFAMRHVLCTFILPCGLYLFWKPIFWKQVLYHGQSGKYPTSFFFFWHGI